MENATTGVVAGATRRSVKESVPLSNHLVHSHVLTDAHGRYTALLHSPSGRLQRLPRGVRA
jgi:hypothetical protein